MKAGAACLCNFCIINENDAGLYEKEDKRKGKSRGEGRDCINGALTLFQVARNSRDSGTFDFDHTLKLQCCFDVLVLRTQFPIGPIQPTTSNTPKP